MLQCTTPAPTTIDTAAELPECPQYGSAVVGTVASEALTEISGVAASRRAPNRLWVHNDSGDGPNVYAMSSQGTLLKKVTLSGVQAIDFEDMAAGLDTQGVPTLFIGDIGDNPEKRDNILIHQLTEPDPASNWAVEQLKSYTLTYPDGPHNAEALLLDPLGKELIIVTKSFSGLSHIFTIPVAALGTQGTLTAVGQIQFGSPPLIGGTTVTGGDIGPNGHYVLLRTYTHAFLWKRKPSQPIEETLTQPPCVIVPESEPQGEAVGFSSEGGHFFSISEWSAQPIYRYEAATR